MYMHEKKKEEKKERKLLLKFTAKQDIQWEEQLYEVHFSRPKLSQNFIYLYVDDSGWHNLSKVIGDNIRKRDYFFK